MFFYAIISILVLSCCYYKIFKSVKQHKRDIISSGHGRVVGFGLCWGPVAIIDLCALYTEHKWALPRQTFLFEMYLVFVSCAINPVIDDIMNSAFRTEFLQVLTFCRRKDRIQPHQ